jgi:hypothetical protein
MAHGPDTEELLRRLETAKRTKVLKTGSLWNGLNIDSLPPLPEDLQELHCNNCGIRELPPLPRTLQKLYCQGTLLTTLPELPDGLIALVCYNTPVASLPRLPTTLLDLTCTGTQITTLPELPPNLSKLSCSRNPGLTELPTLPNRLKRLYCYNTAISVIPELPETITRFDCQNTLLNTKHKRGETPRAYYLRWRARREEEERRIEEAMSMERSQGRCGALKEELAAAAWAPWRVERWLAAGGFEMLEAM